MSEGDFLIFLLFFWEFSCTGRLWTEFGTNFFFSFSQPPLSRFWIFWNFLGRVGLEQNLGQNLFFFLGLSHPVLAKNNTGKRFFNFWNFFAIFFGIVLPGSSMNGILGKIFFITFSAYLIPFWLTIMPETCFFVFWIFLLFFSKFSFSGQVWTEFGTKYFFSLSWPTLTRFG